MGTIGARNGCVSGQHRYVVQVEAAVEALLVEEQDGAAVQHLSVGQACPEEARKQLAPHPLHSYAAFWPLKHAIRYKEGELKQACLHK